MSGTNVTIEILEITILVPVFITFIIMFYKSATLVMEVNKAASGMYSVCLSALIIVGMKKQIMLVVLLPCAVLGTVFFSMQLALFIVHYREKKTRKKGR